MDAKIHAVLTGDVVRSTSIEADYNEKLQDIAEEIRRHVDRSLQMEIYRGDSFQGVVIDPQKALEVSMLMRAGLRRNSRMGGAAMDDIWDARISIGIGTIDKTKQDRKTKVGLLGGDAFVRSGKALDSMKKDKALLKITTGANELDDEFYASCAMADAIIGRWSIEQSEAIYLYLLENLTQEEIGKRLDISQRAVGKRMTTGNIDSIRKFIERYKKAIKWKYNN
jgi:hypothetical protein